MIVEYVRYALTTHAPDEFLAAYSQAVQSLRAAPECLGYEITQCSDDPRALTLRIEWQSASAHMQQFRGGPYFRPFLAHISPFIKEIAEMRHYEIQEGMIWRRSA